jgi:predicted HAD superfamily Cof-like phosphohydrolase
MDELLDELTLEEERPDPIDVLREALKEGNVGADEIVEAWAAYAESSMPMGMNHWQGKVLAFHEASDCVRSDLPRVADAETMLLRKKLISSEARELLDGLEAGDLVEIADGCVDLIYVALGTAISYGIDLEPLFCAVHRANMAKFKYGVRKDADGKVLKPPDWKAPPIEALLLAQGWKP